MRRGRYWIRSLIDGDIIPKDRYLHYDRKKDEIQSMDIGRMSDETKVLLFCIIEYYHLEDLFKLDNLSPLEKCVPLTKPLVIGNHGINEENIYEKMNVVL